MSRAARYRALAGFIVASAVFVAVFVALTLSAFHKLTPHDLRWSLPARTCGCLSHRPAEPALSRLSAQPSQPWRHDPDVTS